MKGIQSSRAALLLCFAGAGLSWSAAPFSGSTISNLPPSIQERLRQLTEVEILNHGMLDNENTALYEQYVLGINGQPVVSDGQPGGDDAGDIRMSNPDFSGNQNEFQIAINPMDPNYAIGTSNDGRTAGVGIYTTSDMGLTWTARDAPSGTSGCCDPAVVYGSDGVAYVGILAAPAITLRSDDNGATWTRMTNVTMQDRNNIAVDPHDSDHVLLTYSELPGSNRIKGYQSFDGGRTWGASFFIGGPAPVQGYEQSSQPQIANDGTIYVGYQQYLDSSGGCAGGVQNVLAVSTDAGATFTQTVLDILQGGACTTQQFGRGIFCINTGGSNFRSRSHPIIGVDPVDSQTVYMIYSGGELETSYTCAGGTGWHSDILFRKSIDGGQTFSDPIAINQDGTGSDQYYPWVDVDVDGTIWVGWNDRRDDPNNFKSLWYQAYSTDQGDTWTEYPVAQVQTQPSTFIGDYHGLAGRWGLILGMWFDSRDNSSGDPYTHPNLE